MSRLTTLLAATSCSVLLVACSGSTDRLEPTAPSDVRADGGVRRIEMLDACDPTTFNAILGANACVRSGGVTFEHFIGQVTRMGEAPSWRFAPTNVQARVGQTLLAINRGGEEHTFTEVEAFGGGVVPILNQLSGNTAVAPECDAITPADRIPAGGSVSDEVEETGTELYQCCIHPWMRTTVTVRR